MTPLQSILFMAGRDKFIVFVPLKKDESFLDDSENQIAVKVPKEACFEEP